MTKREPTAAVGWSGLIWLSPAVGVVLYWLFGINRIRRRAIGLRRGEKASVVEEILPKATPDFPDVLARMNAFAERITHQRLLPGNAITPLIEGVAAYESMLAAIAAAERVVFLSTYIFDNDETGRKFANALGDAKKRGVAVYILIDDAGSRYSFPSIKMLLRKNRLKVAWFLPTWIPSQLSYINLRNHRKILVVDGKIGFTGGMNIRAGHALDPGTPRSIRDLHFKVEGPVLSHLARAFAADWQFAARRPIPPNLLRCESTERGQVWARGVSDGPDEPVGIGIWTVQAALRQAQRKIRIQTPYFVPDSILMSALCVAALSGVSVEILIPEKTNLRFVDWACQACLPYLTWAGCEVRYLQGPFDHSKLLLVDDSWAFVGSSNWDTRSFRLNFEFNLECYDTAFAAQLGRIFDERKLQSEPAPDEVDLTILARFRNRLARLLSPYL
jgi:cardiolipin synthase